MNKVSKVLEDMKLGRSFVNSMIICRLLVCTDFHRRYSRLHYISFEAER